MRSLCHISDPRARLRPRHRPGEECLFLPHFCCEKQRFYTETGSGQKHKENSQKGAFCVIFQLISRPVADYDSLHNATFVDGETMTLAPGSSKTLPVPSAAGGALE